MVYLFIFVSKHFFKATSAWAVYSNIHVKLRDTLKLLWIRKLCELCVQEEPKIKCSKAVSWAKIKWGIERTKDYTFFSFSFLLGLSNQPESLTLLDLCSFQELPYPCSLQGLGETASDLLDEKQGYDLFFSKFFLSDIFRALERKELASPLFIFLTGAVGQS